jgi:dsDNA-specific endonuclease/ATPase MutS2
MSQGDERDEIDDLDQGDLEGRDFEEGELDEAPEIVEVPITDTLDLHTFLPKEIADVVRDYLDAAWEKGLRELRIVHGRGIGVQREIVRKVLERDSRVRSFRDAPPEAGGWGATLVTLGEAS